MAVIITLLIILLFIAIATYAIGSFFMSVAIIRKEKPTDDFVPPAEKASKNDDISERIRKNQAKLDTLAENLHATVKAEEPEITTPDGLTLRASFFRSDFRFFHCTEKPDGGETTFPPPIYKFEL